MPVTVKRANLWRVVTANTPGALAEALAPFAEQKVNLDIMMGYAYPDKRKAAIEVFPVRSGRPQKAARSAGLSKSSFPCVVISGQDRIGLGHTVATALSEAGINLNFCVAQTLGKRYTGMFSFEAESEADLAVKIIRSALRRRPARISKTRSAKDTKRTRAAKKRTRPTNRRPR